MAALLQFLSLFNRHLPSHPQGVFLRIVNKNLLFLCVKLPLVSRHRANQYVSLSDVLYLSAQITLSRLPWVTLAVAS